MAAGYYQDVSYIAAALRFTASGGFFSSTFSDSPFFSSYPTGVLVQPDGRLLLTGYQDNVNFNFSVIRTTDDGRLDASFGSGGLVTTPIANGTGNNNDFAITSVLQPDGKIVLGGYCDNSGKAAFCLARYEGGPFGYKNCKFDIDGDGTVFANTDVLISTRVALGFTGSAVVNGITFPAGATRTTWPLIRDYLASQCGLSLVP